MTAPPVEATFEFRAPDGVVLRCTRVRTGRRRVVLVAPGIFLHRQSDEHRLLARALAEIADVVTLDVRGHGDSGGAFTWGLVEPDDVAALARELRREYDHVGGLGFSFGGYHTGVAAARERPFDAVGLVAAPSRLFILDHNFLTGGLVRSAPLMVRRRRLPTRVSLSPRGRRAALAGLIDRIAPVPLLIAHGTADWLIPASHARTLFARAGEPKELLLLEGALHAENILVDDPGPLLRRLVAFFHRSL